MKQGVLFRTLRSLTVLAAACGIAVFLFAMRGEPERREITEEVPAVQVMEVFPEAKTMVVDAYGTVSARRNVSLAAEVPGRLTYLAPSLVEGGYVTSGELLVRIDQRSYQLEVEAARNEISQALADIRRLEQEIINLKASQVLSRESVNLAAEELSRQKALNKEAFSSISQLDKAKQQELEARMSLQTVENNLAVTDAAMNQKNAVLAQARTGLAMAELALAKTEIRSDLDGFVVSKAVEQGEFIAAGQTLGSIYQIDALDVEVRIPLEKLDWLEPVFAGGGLPEALVTMTTDARSRQWKGRVARIKAGIEETTRTLPMVIEIDSGAQVPGNAGWLKPGAFVQCAILGRQYTDLVVIPRHLLKTGNRVYTVRNGTLLKKTVHVLRKFREEIYIDQGLDPGDQVIVTPLPKAVDGMPVAVVPGNGKADS